MNDLSDFIQINQDTKTNNYLINKHIIKFDEIQEQQMMNPSDSVLANIYKYEEFTVETINDPDKQMYIGQDALNLINA